MASSSRQTQRATPPPFNGDNAPRQPLEPGHACVGCVVWLPPFDSLQDDVYCSKQSCGHEKMDEGGYDHPVVILKIRQRENSQRSGDLVCTVALMSTFRNTTLRAYKKRYSRDTRFQQSIPVQMSSPNDKHTPTSFIANPAFLHLESKSMKKQGYIRYDHTFDVPLAQLKSYGYRRSCVYHYRLSEQSYRVLMGRVGVQAEVYDETDTLFETARMRLARLVATQRALVVSRLVASTRTTSERRQERAPLLPTPYTLPSSNARGGGYYGTAGRGGRGGTGVDVSTRIVAPPYRQQHLPSYVNRYSSGIPEPRAGTEGGWGFVAFTIVVLTAVGLWWHFG